MKSTIRHKARRTGFTLLELLVVVGILVMLMAIALPNFFSQQKQAQVDATSTQIQNFENALKLYQAQNNTFPTTEQSLTALLEKPESEPVPKKWAGPYLDKNNLNDPWGNVFQYAYPGEHNGKQKPDIWSFGPDKEEGTDDDIKNWTGDEKSKDTSK